jgi:SnoaL-like polyketide cyclase
MSEENKAIARRVIEEFLNTGNPEIADEIFASGYVDHNPSNPELRGIENIEKSVDDWHAAFSDTHNTVDDLVAEGEGSGSLYHARYPSRRVPGHTPDRQPGDGNEHRHLPILLRQDRGKLG